MTQLYVIHKDQCEVVDVGLELTIGRSYANRLRLDGPDVSRAHAIIYRRANEFVLRDLDSKNGVFVNGKRMPKRALESEDKINIGDYLLIFDPPESVDLSQWARVEKPPSAAGFSRESDTQIQKRHQHFPVSLIEKSFVENQTLQDFTINRASPALRFGYQILTRLGEVDTDEAVCKKTLQWAIDAVSGQRGMVALRRDHETRPRAVAIHDTRKNREIKIHQRLLDWLFEHGEALISVESCEESKPPKLKGVKFANRIAMPLTVKGATEGFIYIENDPPASPFTVDDLQRLFCIATVASRRLKEVE